MLIVFSFAACPLACYNGLPYAFLLVRFIDSMHCPKVFLLVRFIDSTHRIKVFLLVFFYRFEALSYACAFINSMHTFKVFLHVRCSFLCWLASCRVSPPAAKFRSFFLIRVAPRNRGDNISDGTIGSMVTALGWGSQESESSPSSSVLRVCVAAW